MTRLVVESVIESRLHGVTRVPLTLCYRVSDPAAVGISLLTCCGPVSWLTARDAIKNGLDVDRVVEYADEAAATVRLSRRPGAHHALLILRTSDRLRWPLMVPVGALEAFVKASYIACPPEREAQIIAEELAVQCGFFHLAHGNGAA